MASDIFWIFQTPSLKYKTNCVFGHFLLQLHQLKVKIFSWSTVASDIFLFDYIGQTIERYQLVFLGIQNDLRPRASPSSVTLIWKTLWFQASSASVTSVKHHQRVLLSIQISRSTKASTSSSSNYIGQATSWTRVFLGI